MRIKFYATLREIVGGSSVEIPAQAGIRARALFELILERFPGLRKELLDEHGELYGHVHFFINGRDIQFHELGWDTPVGLDDQVTIFPAIGGGAR